MASASGKSGMPGRQMFWNRSWTMAVIVLWLTVAAAVNLDLFGEGAPDDGLAQFRDFFGKAFAPTLTGEADKTLNLLPEVKRAATTTILVAFAAMSLAIVGGFILGCLASEAFWAVDSVVMENRWLRFSRRVMKPILLTSTRSVMAFMRSIHEIFWAILGVSVFGLSITCGILAIAIPYAATLGRIYAELLDETDRSAANALRACGGSNLGIFVFGLLPRAASAMLSYTFYRFDCSLRSSAILGFIGFETLGQGIQNAVSYHYYREAWTYLYVLFFILIATEFMSGALRRRIAAWR